MEKSTSVKNKNPAPIQISAEQLLRESNDRKETAPPLQEEKIHDQVDLDEYKWRKRKQFEDALRLNRINFGQWIRYAQFEESQQEFERARSIYERALVYDSRNHTIWMRYAEMEMKNKFVNHARNVFDRAVTMMPRVDQFWYKYAYMEEMLGNIGGARQIFERWMNWEPNEEAFSLYVKLEKRYKEKERIRQIYKRFVLVHPDGKNWVKWAKFEEECLEFENARQVYQGAIDALGVEHADQQLFISFARFETKMKEYERARAIYQYAERSLPKEKRDVIAIQYTLFEKQFGLKGEIEEGIFKKRRIGYEVEVKENPGNYDAWFDLLRLEESCVETTNLDPLAIERCRDAYERAIASIPPVQQKRYWRRYIYLWIYYAIFEELVMKDVERTRAIFTKCLSVIPHKVFTFAKVWILYAKFEIRQMNLIVARKTLGRGIGMCPKSRLFKGYIELELQLREFDRCRTLYQQFLKYSPSNVYAWIKFAELEKLLDDLERSRAIFELAVNQPLLDMPELLWKSYIDFEYQENEWDKVRSLYRRLLDRTRHPKVWKSFAEFEVLCVGSDGNADGIENFMRARSVLQEGHNLSKTAESKEERRLMLITWLEFEKEHYKESFPADVPDMRETLQKRMPQQVKKRRRVYPEDPTDATMEEYFDYVFPEDEIEGRTSGASGGVSKLLEMARKWKESQENRQ